VQEKRSRVERAHKNRRILGCASLLAALAIAATGSSAFAQSGGTGTTTTPAPSATTAGSWTVYKKATWYGPGLWGERTACGMTLAPTVIGAAHRKLPCGTTVTFSYAGRSVTGTVIDRGPFRKGYAWDLTKKTAKRVGFLTVGKGPIAATVTPPAY
jgi:rare lipoprotein A (peptidoglycan hydrolase)